MSEICKNCGAEMKAAYVTIPHPLAFGHPDGEKHTKRVIGYHCENDACPSFTARPDELWEEAAERCPRCELHLLQCKCPADEPKGGKDVIAVSINGVAYRGTIQQVLDCCTKAADSLGDQIDSLQADLQAERTRREEYERMMSEAYCIDFTDRERTIHKSGSYESSTGIIWTVKDDESESVLSRHETALDAYRAITQDSSGTSGQSADLSADHPESSE